MKKQIALILSLLCFSVCLCGCSTKLPQNRNRSEAEILQEIDNAVSVKEAVSMKHSRSVAEKYCAEDHMCDLAGFDFRPSLQEVDNELPIELLRQVNHEGTPKIYAVFRIKGGGLLFLFFGQVMDTTQTTFYKLCDAIYSEKAVKTADFAGITEGSTYKDVLRADRAARVWKKNIDQGKERLESGEASEVAYTAVSSHIVENGVITVFYKGTTVVHLSTPQGTNNSSFFTVWNSLTSCPILSIDRV